MVKEKNSLYILPKMHSGNSRKILYYYSKNLKITSRLIKIFFRRDLNIYEACVPDRMHHIDLGLFKYQLDFTFDILKEVGGVELQNNFDEWLRKIPHFSGLKLLSKLGHLKVITAADYRHIMKIAIFALDDIFGEWNNIL